MADYPFTTLEPMLGVVDWTGEGDVFTLADVPGLLEGASEGVGLGHEFLAHLERCQLLLHVVDVTGYYGVEPLEGFRTILAELDAHAVDLASKPQIIVLNKIDAVPPEVVEEWETLFVAEVERLRSEGHPAFTYEIEGRAAAGRAAGVAGLGRHRGRAQRSAHLGGPAARAADGARAGRRRDVRGERRGGRRVRGGARGGAARHLPAARRRARGASW